MLVLAGCSPSTGTTTPSAEEQPVTAATYVTSPCPVPMVIGMPETDLGPDVICGTLTVPQNRAQADGRTIKLTVATLPAQSPDPGRAPMVYLNGGPGSTILPYGEALRSVGINRDRDVILVSQRGTLHADPELTCPEIDQRQHNRRGCRCWLRQRRRSASTQRGPVVTGWPARTST